MKRLSLLVVVLVALLSMTFSTGLAAVLTIDTVPYWQGGYFMLPDVATAGQVITAPAGATEINDFSFQMNNPATTSFRGFVYAWDGSKATGSPLYESGDRNNLGTPEVITFDAGHVQVAPGAQYVLFVSTSRSTGSGIGNLGFVGGTDTYIGGLRVWLNNSTDVSAWTASNWRLIQDNSDLAFRVHFTTPDSTPCFTLTTTVAPSAGGELKVSPSPNCAIDPTKYASGTVVTLVATPDSFNGYAFSGWNGDVTGTASTTTVTMNGDKVVTATFSTLTCYKLTTTVNPQAVGSINAYPGPNCATDPTKYARGTAVMLSASPGMYNGYVFSSWTGDASGTANPITVTMVGDRSITANFVRPCFGLTTASSPANAGSVAVDPAPNCTTEAGKYVSGTTVTLTATASAGYVFSNWSGSADNSSNPMPVWMVNGDKSITANFSPFPCFSLTTASSPAGGGSVAVSPSPNCLTDASKYPAGAEVTFTATASPGYAFSGWSGDLGGADNPKTVSWWMGTFPRSVTANFSALPCFPLILGHSGSGSNPIANPTNSTGCSAGQYHRGEIISLTASPAPGWQVSEWNGTGNDSSTSTTISVTMPGLSGFDYTVWVYYSQIPCYTLTRASNPAPGGTIGASPSPNCVTAPGNYVTGTEVALTAKPNTGYTFSGWGVDVTGTTNPTTVTMNADKNVTANFTGAPDLAVTNFTAAQTRTGSRAFNLSWTVANQGPLAAPGAWKDTVYLSADGTLDSGDTVLKKSVRQRESLAAGATYSDTLRVNLPRGDTRRYLILRTDDENNVAESDEGNNLRVFQITAPVTADAPDEADADLP